MTFTFTMDAFPAYTKFDKTKKVLAALQVITDDVDSASEKREACIPEPTVTAASGTATITKSSSNGNAVTVSLTGDISGESTTVSITFDGTDSSSSYIVDEDGVQSSYTSGGSYTATVEDSDDQVSVKLYKVVDGNNEIVQTVIIKNNATWTV